MKNFTSFKSVKTVKLFTSPLFLFLVLFGIMENKAQAQSIGIYESYAIINSNGAGNAFYDLTAASGNPDFSGTNFGTFNHTQTLVLAGAQNKTFKCSGGNVTGGNTYYRIWLQGGSAPSYTTLSPVMSFVSNDAGGCGGNQTWQTNTATVNLLQGLGVGTYNVEVYTDVTGTPGTVTTSSFTATFTVNSVFGDSFNRGTLSPGGSPSVTYTTTTIANVTATTSTFLNIGSGATAPASGVAYVTGSTSTYASPYATTLSSNTGVVTWTTNFRWNRGTSNPAVPASGAYGSAIVLAGSSATLTGGNGYAIVYGSAGTPDPIRLVAYTGGIIGGTLTDICTSAASDLSATNNYASIRVTYNPTTNSWSLFVRDDGATAWADPISGVTAQKGSTTTNSTYTGTSLTTFGFVHTFGAGTNTGSQFDNFNVQVAPSTTPTLSTPTAVVTSSTSATLGATVVSNGGSSLTARGTAYKTVTGVVATDNQLAEGGTGVSAFTHSRTGLNPQTQYFYVGYATNTVPNTGISSEGSFRTWSEAATVQPATFTTTAGNTTLTANWGTATFPGSGATRAGYVVIYATGTPTLSSANGTAPAAGVGTLVNITSTVLPTTPALTTTITGLTNGTLYNLLIVPYTWDGTNASTYNYFTTGAPTTTGTPTTTSYTWNGGTSGAWSTPANWTPATSVAGPTTGDRVTFSTGGNISVTSVPTVSLGSITVSTTGTNVTLASPSTGNITVTLSNAGTALSIATGTTLNLVGNTTSSRTMTLAYSGAGNTATVAGILNLQTSGAGTANYNATNSTTTVTGILRSSTSTGVITSTSSNLIIAANGEYNHATDGGQIPTAGWNIASTCNVTGVTATVPTVATFNQTFGNFTWNCTGQTVDISLVGNLLNVAGTLRIASTGAGANVLREAVNLIANTTFSIGNFIQTGGVFYIMGTGASVFNITVNVSGNFDMNGGTFNFNQAGFTTVLNLAGNFTMNGGTIANGGGTVVPSFRFNGSTAQTVSKTAGTISGIINFIVPSPSIVRFPATSVLDGTTATFNLNSGATLQTANTLGITSSGANGSVQVGGTRTFATGGNYVYNGATNQATGNGLPATVNTLTINNTGTSPNNIVTLTAITAISATTNSLVLTAGKLDLNTKQLTIPSGGTISASAGDFTTTAGPVYFLGTGTVSGTVNFPTVRLSGGVNFGLDSTIVTSMLMESGSFITTNAPTYGIGSTLIYNTTGTYGRNLEWSATSGKGYPFHVQVQNGTTVDLSANGFADRAIAGDLNLGLVGAASAGSLSMGATTNKLTVGGNVVIGGNTSGTSTLTLSSAIGGDIYLSGNWDTKTNGSYASNTRAVFFQGTGTSTVTTIGAATFDYLFVNKTSGGTVSLANDMTVNNNLTLNAQLVTNAFKVIIPTGNNVTANPSGWVRGNLQKNIPTGTTSRTFEVGDTTTYAPVITDYTGVTGAGNIVVKTTSGDHPQIATSNIDANRSVNRNYSITNSGVTGGSYDATFAFVGGDVDSGADTATFGVGNYVNPTWSATAVGTRTSTSTKATGLSTYGDFQLGESKTMWTGGASTTDWATSGNWSFGVPTSSTNTYISTAGVYPIIASTAAAKTLTVNSGTTLEVASGYNLTVTGALSNSGTFTLNNNANLLQGGTTNSNSGNIVVKRNSAALKRLDYTLWSSPVAGQGLYAFSKFTLPNRFYVYDSTNDVYSNSVGFNLTNLQYPSPLVSPNGVDGNDLANVPFEPATGYLIRTPYNHPTSPTVWTGTFTGKPNNGTITRSSLTSGLFYAVGNPYPSTISADQFIADNSIGDNPATLGDGLYFWRKTNNAAASSYATYTTAGGVKSGGDTLNIVPSGIIQVGEGFIVKTTSTSLSFNNGQRLANNADQFLKSAIVERNRIWLNLTDTNSSVVNQMMVSYMTGATQGIDPAIDGRYFNDNATALNSLLNNEEFAIQGRSLPFDASDVVPLAFKSEAAGNYTIALDQVDGLFVDGAQKVYLKDNLTSTEHDLSIGGYTFATEAGTFNNRFEVIYQSQLGISNPAFTANAVIIYRQNNDFVVNTGSVIMASVKIFDIRGRLLQEKKGVNASQTIINGGLANEVLLVQITSEDGVVVTKKVVR